VASKKKTSRERNRSEESIKGWVTRRKNKALKRLDASHPELTGIEDEYTRALIEAGIKAGVAAEIERRDTAINSEISKRLVETLIKEGKIEDTAEQRIVARLRIALDDERYYDEVLELGDEYPEYSLGEIYTMGMS
jgi:hypothetical protein